MRQKIIDFIKYHNAFTIGLILVLFGAGAIFAASPEARDAVIGKEITQTEGVDNAALLAVDLNNFDLAVKIDNVTEDSKNYYVDYSFNTYGIIDNVWQKIARKVSMTVDKASLNGGDLGLYVQSQLANVAQNEIAYLKQVQTAEKEKGLTRVVVSREYTGLVGLVLDVKNAVLPDYEPVIEPQSIELAQVTPSVPVSDSDEETKVKAELEKPTQTPPTDQGGTANIISATAAVSGGNPPTSDNQSLVISDHPANEGQTGDSSQSSTGNATSTITTETSDASTSGTAAESSVENEAASEASGASGESGESGNETGSETETNSSGVEGDGTEENGTESETGTDVQTNTDASSGTEDGSKADDSAGSDADAGSE